MPIRAIMLAAALANHVVLPAQDNAVSYYPLFIVQGDVANELKLYATGEPVVIGENNRGVGIAFFLAPDGGGIDDLRLQEKPRGVNFTEASICSAETGTVWLNVRVDVEPGREPLQGYLNFGQSCEQERVAAPIAEDERDADDTPVSTSIKRFPLSNRATRYFLSKDIRGEDLIATDKAGVLVDLQLNPSLAWLRRACVSVNNSQISCYTKSDQTQLCHKTTKYIYNDRRDICYEYTKRWKKQTGSKPCSC